MSTKVSAFERATLHLQMGGTVRYRMGDEIHAVRLVDGKVAHVDDVMEGA
jgi:plastocyanin